MKVKMIKKIEHRFIDGLSKAQRAELMSNKEVDVNQEAADFLFKCGYVTEVKETYIKPKVKKSFTKTDEEPN